MICPLQLASDIWERSIEKGVPAVGLSYFVSELLFWFLFTLFGKVFIGSAIGGALSLILFSKSQPRARFYYTTRNLSACVSLIARCRGWTIRQHGAHGVCRLRRWMGFVNRTVQVLCL